MVAGDADAETDGTEFTVNVTVELPVQPEAVVPVTLYIVVDVGDAVKEDPVPPGLQVYVLPPVAEIVEELPEQTEAGDAVAVIAADAPTLTFTDAVPVQPEFVTVTVYTPEFDGVAEVREGF